MINNDFSAASPIIFSTRPTLLSSISIEPAADNDSKEFLKQASFSPDGNYLMCCGSDPTNRVNVLQLDVSNKERYSYYRFSSDIDEGDSATAAADDDNNDGTSSISMDTFRSISVGESIYDCQWYPLMSAQDPASAVFLSTSRDHPIHLWDLHAAAPRCSYAGYDHVDELDPAVCVTFNPTGTRIYAGSNRMIRWFDVSYPGRTFNNIPTCNTRKSLLGQKGLISCLSFNPDLSGSYAAGSYDKSICVYVEDMQGAALELCALGFGVTHMKVDKNVVAVRSVSMG
eukprot:gene36743-49540_t